MIFGKKPPKAQDVMDMIEQLSDEEKAELKIFLSGDAEDKEEDVTEEVAETTEDEGADTAEADEDAPEAPEAEEDEGEKKDDDAEEPAKDATEEAGDDVIATMQREIEGLHEAIKGIVARLDGEPDAKHEEESGETEAADEEDAMKRVFGVAMGDPGAASSKRESDWDKARRKYFPGI